MDISAYRNEIKTELTGGVLELEIADTDLDKIINSALREIQRYIDSTRLVTVPYSGCINLKEYNVSSVSGVYRTDGLISAAQSQGVGSTADPMWAAQWQILSGTGNIYNLSSYSLNYAAWNTLLQIRNTFSTDLSFRYERDTQNLYINVSNNTPTNITIEYIPQFQDVSEVHSDFWVDVLLKLALAKTKIILGRVRSKYTQSNALWTLDGATLLQEGNEELIGLREKLQANTQLVYPTD